MKPSLANLRRRLMRSEDGVAMVEFAMVAPVMAVLTIGGLELANLAITHMRVSEIANTVSDNAGRVTSGMDEANIYEIFAGAGVLGSSIDFEPDGRVVISSLQDNGGKGGAKGQKIEWQRCWGDLNVAPKYGKQGKGKNDATLKDGLGPPGRRIKSQNGNAVMFAEVSYKHTPLFLNGFIKERTIRYETAFNVRDSSNRMISNTQNLAVMSC
ncbi:TadE/TadG family type IV pilus assembly protein [Qipengyuania sp. G39]|uniref:TadE/TadG family type IV pilus assembly protein n=1 Tax=Qipengyuania profundimaris TaxID=3067652 RepID=A0ABT9HT30_9SPHN|nr:TadE/TadG family type IV pilus assembly protein [Qipengyuania sp. G39]MDP4576308.1 TadE/TadG family type IV pilus assembly protein [Qipengyuania sp. G39]